MTPNALSGRNVDGYHCKQLQEMEFRVLKLKKIEKMVEVEDTRKLA